MELMITTCPECNYRYPIAKSKRVQTCPNCACIKSTGFSLKEIANRKAKESMERSRLKSQAKQAEKPKTAYKIPVRSKKGAKQERAVSATKKKLKSEAMEGGFVQCGGCGNYFDTIEGSHKVQLSKTSELASVPENIRLLCRSCHSKWGEGTVPEMISLICFCEDMEYLLDNDPERFWKIFYRLVDEYSERPTPKLDRVISKLERLDT